MLATQQFLQKLDLITTETTDQFVQGLTRDNAATTSFTYIDRITVRRQNPAMQLIEPKEVPLEEDTKKQQERVN